MLEGSQTVLRNLFRYLTTVPKDILNAPPMRILVLAVRLLVDAEAFAIHLE